MKNKPLLSIIIPVAPNREDRLKAILSRLTLNKRLFPDHTFEVVICDGGATDGTRELCQLIARAIPLKYIYVPICRFINAGYPRNVALRVCEGDVIGMIDIDHWPCEHIVYGMLNPFVDDKNFRVMEINELEDKTHFLKDIVKNVPGFIFNQYTEGTHNVLNRGYVIDSSKSGLGWPPNVIPDQLLNQANMALQIHEVYRECKIRHGINNTLWCWSAYREMVNELNGYDEIYCRQFAYSREDDDWRERLKTQITGLHHFIPHQGFFDGQNKNFCAIHLWHPATWRGQDTNNLNKVYYPTVCEPVRTIKRNLDWPWGKLLDYSLSVINGISREPKEHEQWINENIHDVPHYTDSPTWSDIDEYMEELDKYVQKKRNV